MLKAVLAFSLLFLVACDAKNASVASKPFPETHTDGFQTQSMNQMIDLSNTAWFFWKNHDDMATVMRLNAGLEIVSEKLTQASVAKVQLEQERLQYILENLGPDNTAIWEDLNQKWQVNVQEMIYLQESLAHEEQRQEQERDEGRITEILNRINELHGEQAELEEQIVIIEQQSGVPPDFAQHVVTLKEQIQILAVTVQQLQTKAKEFQGQLLPLVEWLPEAPRLLLQEKDEGIYIELVNFGRDNLACSTDTGLIRDVQYNKVEGLLQFTMICKQPVGIEMGQLVSYQMLLEKIPSTSGFVISGNIGRCIDILPNLGKCEGGLTYGVVTYKQ